MLTIKRLTFSLLLLFYITTSVKGSGQAAQPAKTCTVNLDLLPLQRWNNFTSSCGFNLTKGREIINALIKSVVKPEVIELLQDVGAKLDDYLPLPYSDELRGLSSTLGLPLGDLVILNLLYDITAYDDSSSKACTSIVASDKQNKIIHGRNLDYQMQPKYLREITIQVDFQRNKKSLFMATTYVGYIGVITGCRHGAFSISGDERDKGKLWKNILTALNGGKSTFFAQRMILEQARNYEEALQMAINTPTIAPVYFILGGVKSWEGAIVVKDSGKVANVSLLGSDLKHPWYIVETNYDPWLRPPATDDRRDAAINAMNKVGKNNFSPQQLYNVLSVNLVFNKDTTYTTIMSAADPSVYHTMIRYDAPN
uniref:N-acylethanolamine-hydrolyzing acid amidase n=1 Tax=Ciona intestinalis TaxID=7719 RepID=H2XVT8_CIOIN|nr:N-acylethanolamine-hydrolyzing acid amidase-like isoform X1 [Ciona intestinalis]XP_026690758.1 N-acylethanolamine-hydrolyzing acid amidase-like isoform X1 [Ciona intestinalis]XP_026690759.1 N-acylethanolamine-hydrolyzing acid amidase-like isoform X1 [Ciona intestinalis]|eukprot:XP_002128649.1 N-acylethanolamine-hydrolyzing acid amidase-like isoform X1 [Ciona intestinalis]